MQHLSIISFILYAPTVDITHFLQIRKIKGDNVDSGSLLPPEWEKLRVNFQPTLTNVRYAQNRPVVYQSMMLSAILAALKQQHHCHMHR